jgi:hypothetical protein
VLSNFIAIKSPGFELALLGCSGKHTNHYTTEATWVGGYFTWLGRESGCSYGMYCLHHLYVNIRHVTLRVATGG